MILLLVVATESVAPLKDNRHRHQRRLVRLPGWSLRIGFEPGKVHRTLALTHNILVAPGRRPGDRAGTVEARNTWVQLKLLAGRSRDPLRPLSQVNSRNFQFFMLHYLSRRADGKVAPPTHNRRSTCQCDFFAFYRGHVHRCLSKSWTTVQTWPSLGQGHDGIYMQHSSSMDRFTKTMVSNPPQVPRHCSSI